MAPVPGAPRPGGWSTGKRLLVIFGVVALAGVLGVALLAAGLFTFYRHSANVTMVPITAEDIQRIHPGMTEDVVMKILNNANEMASNTLNTGEPVAVWTYKANGQTNRQPATLGFFDHRVARVVAGEQAMSWLSADFFRALAEAGDARAQRLLGVFYYHGEGGLAKDRAEAKTWFLKAAVQGDEDAKRVLREQYPENAGGGPATTPANLGSSKMPTSPRTVGRPSRVARQRNIAWA